MIKIKICKLKKSGILFVKASKKGICPSFNFIRIIIDTNGFCSHQTSIKQQSVTSVYSQFKCLITLLKLLYQHLNAKRHPKSVDS